MLVVTRLLHSLFQDADSKAMSRRVAGYFNTVRAGLNWGYGKLFGGPDKSAGAKGNSEAGGGGGGSADADPSSASANLAERDIVDPGNRTSILLHFDYVASPVPRVKVRVALSFGKHALAGGLEFADQWFTIGAITGGHGLHIDAQRAVRRHYS